MSESKDLVVQQREYLQRTFAGPTFQNALQHIASVMQMHGFDPRRLLEVSIFEFSKTPELMQCTPISKIRAVLEAAKQGLEPDGRLGWMIARRNQGTLEAQFMSSFIGEMEAVRRICPVVRLACEVVRENDLFEFEPSNLEGPIKHRIVLHDEEARGQIFAAWAIARTKDGGLYERVLYQADIERAKLSSKGLTKKDGSPNPMSPWNTHEAEMWRKTAIRRLAKKLPRTRPAPFAWEAPFEVDDLISAPPTTISVGASVVEDAEPATKSRSDEMAEMLTEGLASPGDFPGPEDEGDSTRSSPGPAKPHDSTAWDPRDADLLERAGGPNDVP